MHREKASADDKGVLGCLIQGRQRRCNRLLYALRFTQRRCRAVLLLFRVGFGLSTVLFVVGSGKGVVPGLLDPALQSFDE